MERIFNSVFFKSLVSLKEYSQHYTPYFIFFLFFSHSVVSQHRSLQGFVYDDASGEPLIGATVYDTLSGQGCITNLYGFFNLLSTSEQIHLSVSYVGYQPHYQVYQLDQNQAVIIKLTSRLLDEVVVSEGKGLTEPVSRQVISVKKLLSAPMLGGEPDIVKSLALLPGISQGVEGTSGLYIRGGTPDQNLVLLDEAPVYNLSHLFGFVSIFNGDAVKHVDVSKAGFSADYGGRLSSVVDVSLMEGNREKLYSEMSLGLVSSRFLIEGPLQRSKNSFLIAARSSYLGLILLPNNGSFLNGNSDYFLNYWMYDITTKLNFELKNGGRLFVSYYGGDDRWTAREGDYRLDWSNYRLIWGNRTASIRHYKPLNSRFFVKNNAYYTRYNYQTNISEIDAQTSLRQPLVEYGVFSRVEDISLNSSLEFFPIPNESIKGGIQSIWHQYSPGLVKGTVVKDSLSDYVHKIGAFELATYVQNSFAIPGKFNLEAGLRATSYSVQDTSYYRLEPRVSASYKISPTWSVRGAVDKMNQFVHLLTSYSFGPSNDIWFPATSSIPPSSALQADLGFVGRFSGWEVSVEGYEKRMDQLIDYTRGLDVLEAFQNGIENLVQVGGIGRVRGLEVFSQKSFGNLQGWMSYTLSKNTRQFDGIDEGRVFYSNFDRRHSLSLVMSYAINESWSFNSTFVYQSGRRISMPVSLYRDLYGQPTFQYGGRNNFKMPDYNRLDLAAHSQTTSKKGKKRELTLSVYNVYNRINPFYVDINNKQPSSPANTSYKVTSNGVLQFFPSISYTWEL